MLIHGSGFTAFLLEFVLVDPAPCLALTIILLSIDKDSNQRALTGALTPKHGYLNALSHMLLNISAYRGFGEIAIVARPSANVINLNLSILTVGHIKQEGQGFLKLLQRNSRNLAVVFDADSVDCGTFTLVQPPPHLGGKMLYAIRRWIIEHELVFHVTVCGLLFHFLDLLHRICFLFQPSNFLDKMWKVIILLHTPQNFLDFLLFWCR